MQYAWFILITCVFIFVVVAWGTSKINDARKRRQRQLRLPDTTPPLVVEKTYNVQMSHGRIIENVTVVGVSEDSTADENDWNPKRWLVTKIPDGRHVYMRPESIRYVEDAKPV